jgi:hypothetical protein
MLTRGPVSWLITLPFFGCSSTQRAVSIAHMDAAMHGCGTLLDTYLCMHLLPLLIEQKSVQICPDVGSNILGQLIAHVRRVLSSFQQVTTHLHSHLFPARPSANQGYASLARYRTAWGIQPTNAMQCSQQNLHAPTRCHAMTIALLVIEPIVLQNGSTTDRTPQNKQKNAENITMLHRGFFLVELNQSGTMMCKNCLSRYCI